MRRNSLFALALAGLCATPLQAQDAEDLAATCAGIPASQVQIQNVNPVLTQSQREAIVTEVIDELRFACGTVATALSNLQPSIGIGFSGGNPTLGMGGTLGTRFGLIPRFTFTARVNAAIAEFPELDQFAATLSDANDQLGPAPTARAAVGALQGDVAVGVFNGITLVPMLGGLGSVDLLGSVAFVPAISRVGIEEAFVTWGAGARIGILKGGLLAPGLSVSGMYRRMGEVAFGDIEDGDPGEFATDLTNLSLRAALSKGFLMFDFVIGAGYDRYTSDPSFNFAVEYDCPVGQPECTAAKADPTQPLVLTMDPALTGEVNTAAWNVFGNVGMSLLLFSLVGELGYQQATDLLSGEDLQGRDVTDETLGEGRFFGSVGLRLTL